MARELTTTARPLLLARVPQPPIVNRQHGWDVLEHRQEDGAPAERTGESVERGFVGLRLCLACWICCWVNGRRRRYQSSTAQTYSPFSSRNSRCPSPCKSPFLFPSLPPLLLSYFGQSSLCHTDLCTLAEHKPMPQRLSSTSEGVALGHRNGDAQPKLYVREQALTMLAMDADASEATFAQVHQHFSPSIR